MITETGLQLITESHLLNEEYYGSNPLLEECDKQFEIIRNKVKANPMYLPNGSNENAKIEAAITTLFNCKHVQILWNRSLMPNACTYPVSFLIGSESLNLNPKPEKGKYGPKFPNALEARLLIHLHVDLMDIADMTPREMTAVLLHEIGHNFQHYTPYNAYLNRIINIMRSSIILITSPINPTNLPAVLGPARDFLKWINDTINSNRTMKDSMNNIRTILGSMKGVLMHTMIIMNLVPTAYLANLTKAIVQIPISYLNPLSGNFLGSGYKDEKFSDIFATRFGYGAECVSVSKKLDSNNLYKKVEPTGTVATMIQLYALPIGMMRTLGDAHPMAAARMLDQINFLESELKYNREISPVTRKEIIKSLDKAKDILAELTLTDKRFENEENVLKRMKAAIYSAMIKWSNGDIRELIFGSKDYKEYNILR